MRLPSPELKRIAIVGAGAVGCFYGACLQRSGRDVAFLMRSDLAVVRRQGLRITTQEETFVLPEVKAAGRPEEIGPVDLVIIALKTTANEALPGLIEPLLHSETLLLTLQNGLGNEALLAERFGRERVLGGLCFVCINRVAPGTIENYLPGSVTIGEIEGPATERVRQIGELFSRAGVKCRVTDDLMEARWRKLVWNVPFNGLAVAAGGITTDRILADDALRELTRSLMDEVAAAAGRLGYVIPEDYRELQIRQTYAMGAYKPSSLIDYLEGKEIEVESIWGEPVRQAKAAGAEVPRMETLYALLKSLAGGVREGVGAAHS